MATSDTTPTAVVEAYLDIWNERDFDAIPDLVAEEFVLYDPAAPASGIPGPEGEAHGRDGLRQFVQMATTGFPDFEIELFEMAANDGVVMWEGQHGGTHEGAFAGLPPTGREFRTRHASVLRVEDGLVREHRAYFDPAVSADQLGVTFPAILLQLPKLVVNKLRATF